MKLAEQLLNKLQPLSVEGIYKALEQKISAFGIEGLNIEDVEVDMEGMITVVFSDDEGDFIEVIFLHDEDEGSVAIINSSESEFEDDEEETIIIELDPLLPSLRQTPTAKFIDLTDLEWLNKSAFLTILNAGAIVDGDEIDIEDSTPEQQDRRDYYGFFIKEDNESYEDLEFDEARKIMVIRGGKRVRLPVARKVRRKVLTGKQKSAIRRAVRKRKMKMSKILRKRRKSLRIRKRVKLKTPKLSRFQKIAGTANRKR